MRIVVDAMGGDFAPQEVVVGAVKAKREMDIDIVLVGEGDRVKTELKLLDAEELIPVVNSTEVIEMNESPAGAVRSKRNSSIVKAVNLVKNGEATAFVSAGSTGAAMAASLLYWGRIENIGRPAIATILPNLYKNTLLLDVGANIDCKPRHLLQFGIMGSIYAQIIMKRSNPTVGLLSIGEEETKGNELTLASYSLLKNSKLNFIGNVEGKDIFTGLADVIVCDGFVGNVVLKTGEGLAATLLGMIQKELTSNLLAKMGTALTLSVLKDLKRKIDYAEYGGAPLLGVNNVCVVSHGRSSSTAIKNAIKMAWDLSRNDVVSAIRNGVAELNGKKVNSFDA